MKFFTLKCMAFINIRVHVGIFHRSKTTLKLLGSL